MYSNGRGVAKDDAIAVTWFRRAAEQGNPAAQYNLGVMYFYGRGVARDHGAALEWYLAAAGQGLANAQNNVGFIYVRGDGVPADNVRAHMWFHLAAEQGHEAADRNLAQLAALMTPEQLAEARRLARGRRRGAAFAPSSLSSPVAARVGPFAWTRSRRPFGLFSQRLLPPPGP
jgi:hypothetical protein